MGRLFVMIVLMSLLAACGRKGGLVPPDSLVPAAVADLRAEQKGEQFYVTWSAPSRDAGGKPLKDLAGFRLFRREVLPPDEDCESCPTAYGLLQQVDLEFPKGVQLYNNLYIFTDTGLKDGTTYQYKLVAYNKEGAESAPSRARSKKVASPAAPRLTATSTPTGVTLEWQPASGAGTDRAGFNVYRRRGSDIATLALLTPQPVKGNRYEDLHADFGVTYTYMVREVASSDGQLVEGAISNEVTGAQALPE
ncbi:fibronectin type III domain-containing protein [Geomobilimonas luticola]|uniref:Fibronectin type III domain-containing protein n=1 Tax=Geomobilimonas luticola TaxID=1114878 RepID=A0ABS5S964_9BACT|nr:lipoprotein [Geomobilimonas luticola]MBT0651695.1 fibronectin type III domain-containing protein [Geomobilimonas luticola]